MPCFCDMSNKFHDSAIILGKLRRLDKLSTSGTGKNDFLFCSASQHGTWEMNPEGNPHATLICTRMELFQFIIHHHPRKQKLHWIKRRPRDPYSVTPCVSPVAFILFMQSSLSASHHWNRIEFRIVVEHFNLTRPAFHSNTSWLAGLSRVLPSFRYPPIHPSICYRAIRC